MKQILVVDDNEIIRESIGWYFKPKGYIVHAAGSAEEALSIIKINRPDILLLDMNLPGISGIELLIAVRQFDKTVKVIMISGEGKKIKEDPRIASLDVFAVMDKPADFLELESMIQKATDSTERKTL